MGLKTNGKTIYNSGLCGSRKIMKIALIISLLFHAGLLLVIQEAFPVKCLSRPLWTFHVEFIRPPLNHTGEIVRTDLAALSIFFICYPLQLPSDELYCFVLYSPAILI